MGYASAMKQKVVGSLLPSFNFSDMCAVQK